MIPKPRASVLLACVLAALLIQGLSFSQALTQNQSLLGISLAGIIVSLFLVALLFAGSKAFGNLKWETTAKEELKSAAITVIVLLLLLGSSAFLDSVADGLYKAVLPGAPDISFPGLSEAASLTTKSNLDSAVFMSKNVRSVLMHYASESTKSRYCGFLGVGYSLTSCSVLTFPTGQLNLAYSSVITAIWALSSQFAILRFAQANGLLILFIGILLRTFLLTRGIGNALISVFIGLAIAYPLMVIAYEALFWELKAKLTATAYPTTAMRDSAGISIADFSYIADLSKFNSMRFYNCPSGSADVYKNIATISKFTKLNVFEPILFEIYFHHMLSVALSLMIALGCISAVGKALGQEIDVFRLEKTS